MLMAIIFSVESCRMNFCFVPSYFLSATSFICFGLHLCEANRNEEKEVSMISLTMRHRRFRHSFINLWHKHFSEVVGVPEKENFVICHLGALNIVGDGSVTDCRCNIFLSHRRKISYALIQTNNSA